MYLMSKQAISVTLDETNLVWLRARAGAGGARSVSALLDRLISDARKSGSARQATSVVGTIDIAGSDPLLLGADAAVRDMFRSSLQRPLLAKEKRASYRASSRRGRPRRG
jgi:hypothetical protein